MLNTRVAACSVRGKKLIKCQKFSKFWQCTLLMLESNELNFELIFPTISLEISRVVK